MQSGALSYDQKFAIITSSPSDSKLPRFPCLTSSALVKLAQSVHVMAEFESSGSRLTFFDAFRKRVMKGLCLHIASEARVRSAVKAVDLPGHCRIIFTI